MRIRRLMVLMMVGLALVVSLMACGGAPVDPVTPVIPPTTSAPEAPSGETPAAAWEWPEIVYFVSSGSSGMAKYVSWTSHLENDVGVKVRVIPEASGVARGQMVKERKMLMTAAGKSAFRNTMEALEEFAVSGGGPFQARMVWVHALANSGMFVRADSEIQDIYDIKPGVRFSVWSDRASVLRVPKAILDWAQVPHDEAHFVNSGSYEGAVRAVMDGRADVFWGFPTSPVIFEASSAPHGIRYIDMNGEADPEGAVRFRETSPMYVFGPINTGVPEARGVWGTQGYTLEITSVDSDPELIYQLVKWLHENYDAYAKAYDTNHYMSLEHVEIAAEQSYMPLHEGLVRYLKELGIWTPAHDKRQAENILLFTRYVDAYDEAKQMARDQGIEISPLNRDWIDLWENHKKELGIPEIRMFTGLDAD
jgi:TRAP transporter TAXI family solute receptor